MSTDPALQQRWININLAALANNLRVIKQALGGASGPKLMAVVKADAYGHGAAKVAPVFRDAGADAFGVTTLDEALELVEAGIESRVTPILLFAPLTSPDQVKMAVGQGLHLTVCDAEQIEVANAGSRLAGQRLSLHLKVGVGMGRLGLDTEYAERHLADSADWAGFYTHFPHAADPNGDLTVPALSSFLAFCGSVASRFPSATRHCANSAAALRWGEARLDMVRVGTALYGQMPSASVPKPEGLRDDTFQAQAQVVFTRTLKKGDTVGYGSEFTAPSETKTAVLPIGFADGFGVAPTSLYRGLRGVKQILGDRDPKRRPYVTIHGERAYVLGRVAMQMIVVDITNHKREVKIGDIADVPMRRLSASARLPRRYLE